MFSKAEVKGKPLSLLYCFISDNNSHRKIKKYNSLTIYSAVNASICSKNCTKLALLITKANNCMENPLNST